MTKAKSVKNERFRLQRYIDSKTADRLRAHAAARGVSETSLVDDALRQYLDGTSDATLYLRRLDRLGRELRRNQRDLELLSEAFSIWVRLWFAHTPGLPDEAKQAARASAEGRYRQYVEHISSQFSGGKRFLDDLPREIVTNGDVGPEK